MLVSRALVAYITLVTSVLTVGIRGASADTLVISPPILMQGIRYHVRRILRRFSKTRNDFLNKKKSIAP